MGISTCCPIDGSERINSTDGTFLKSNPIDWAPVLTAWHYDHEGLLMQMRIPKVSLHDASMKSRSMSESEEESSICNLAQLLISENAPLDLVSDEGPRK